MRVIFSLMILLVSLTGVSAQTLLRAEEPGWVIAAKLPKTDPALKSKIQGGVLFLLSDDQIRYQGEVTERYSRIMTKVTDRTGLEFAATIKQDFDPEFDTLTLTRLRILRGDQVIDVRPLIREDIVRRESNLDSGIIDGRLTAVLQVPDLRVGDIVDQAFIRANRPPIAGTGLAGSSVLEFGVPVVLSRLVLNWPADRPLHLGDWPDRVSHTEVTEGGIIRHEWQRVNNLPPREEEAVPVEADPTAIIRYSAYADWGFLTSALNGHYTKDYPLTPDWEARLARIKAENATDAARAYAALRLVQDDIRYVSLSIGVGGILAREPAVVIQTGYGDCKDKSLLLRTLLTRLGITANVALTDIDAGHGLMREEPMLWAFDHAIVRAEVDGQRVWMDGTAVQEGGGLTTAVTPDYGYTLPLRADQRALEPIALSDQTSWNIDSSEEFQFGDDGIRLTVKTVHSGVAGNHYRYRFASESRDAIRDEFLDYYAGRYPGVESAGAIRVTDNRDENRFETVERYFVPVAALSENGLREDFLFGSGNYASGLPKVLSGKRTLPLAAGDRASFRHKVTVRDAPISFRAPPPVRIENSAFKFAFSGAVPKTGELRLFYKFSRTGAPVPADEVAGVIRDAQVLGNSVGYSWDLTPDKRN
jgi:Domain of Unknown Function with PDB structure (DUF3857)